jgi:molecular chaperone GrpE
MLSENQNEPAALEVKPEPSSDNEQASRLQTEQETLIELVKDLPNQNILIEKLQSKPVLQWSDLVSFYRMALYGFKDLLRQKDEAAIPNQEQEAQANKDALAKAEAKTSEQLSILQQENESLKQTLGVHENTIRNREEAVKDALNIIDRLKQDFEHQRVRNRLEKTNMAKDAKKDLLLKFLDIFDNFERAQIALLNTDNVKSIVEGIAMISDQFNQLLKSEGVMQVLVGDEINPSLHDVIHEEINPELPVENSIEELRKGYYYEGSVLRPAWVKVIRNQKKEIVIPEENKNMEFGDNEEIKQILS